MVFDRYDFEFLRLCGVCRYLPTGLMRKFDAPYFKSGVIGTLKDRGYIKTQSDKLSYKLTKEGKRVLEEMGYIFSDDVRMNIKRQAYKRKLCHPNKNGHRKASKNGMNRILSFVFERRPHLFHGSLDNEPLPT